MFDADPNEAAAPRAGQAIARLYRLVRARDRRLARCKELETRRRPPVRSERRA
jgi:hypothetical protein